MTRRRRRSKSQKSKRCVLKFKFYICYVPEYYKPLLQNPKDLPDNKAITCEISRLCEKWQCHSTSCGGSHCFVHPEEKNHFLLSQSFQLVGCGNCKWPQVL